MIARMCLSDLHLGDARSVLSCPETVVSVVSRLVTLAGGPGPDGDRPEIGTLILNGDIWEECVPSNMVDGPDMFQRSVLEVSQRFFGTLLDAIDIGKIVWVPGNHDLSLWKLWCSLVPSESKPDSVSHFTRYEGRPLDIHSQQWRSVFDYLLGRRPVTAFWASYPLYVDEPWAGGFPFVLFTHGHLLDPLVRGMEPEATYLALKTFGCRRPNVPANEVMSVREIAEFTDDFISALWKRYSRRDWIYSNQVMRRLEHPVSCLLQSRTPRDRIGIVDPSTDPSSPRDGLMAQVPWFLDVVVCDPGLPTPVGDLRTHNPGPALTKPSCLVYGHDHLGSMRTVVSCGVPFVAVDSGGWTSEYDGHLPHSHVLVWRDSGIVVPEAYLLHTRLGEENV